MWGLTLCVLSILAAASAIPLPEDDDTNRDEKSLLVPPTGDDDPLPEVSSRLAAGPAGEVDSGYSAALKDLKVIGDKVHEVLLKETPKVDDPKLHLFLVMALVDATANTLLRSPNTLSPMAAYKETVNKKLPLLYKDAVNASADFDKNLESVKSALSPLFKHVEKLCRDADDKTCDQLLQVTVNKKPELVKAVELLQQTHQMAMQYLDLNKDVELAARKLSGIGYALHNINELASYSLQWSQILGTAKKSKPSTEKPTVRPVSTPAVTLGPTHKPVSTTPVAPATLKPS